MNRKEEREVTLNDERFFDERKCVLMLSVIFVMKFLYRYSKVKRKSDQDFLSRFILACLNIFSDFSLQRIPK